MGLRQEASASDEESGGGAFAGLAADRVDAVCRHHIGVGNVAQGLVDAADVRIDGAGEQQLEGLPGFLHCVPEGLHRDDAALLAGGNGEAALGGCVVQPGLGRAVGSAVVNVHRFGVGRGQDDDELHRPPLCGDQVVERRRSRGIVRAGVIVVHLQGHPAGGANAVFGRAGQEADDHRGIGVVLRVVVGVHPQAVAGGGKAGGGGNADRGQQGIAQIGLQVVGGVVVAQAHLHRSGGQGGEADDEVGGSALCDAANAEGQAEFRQAGQIANRACG